MNLRPALYCGAAALLLWGVATCYSHQAAQHVTSAAKAEGAADAWHQVADTHHASADDAARSVQVIRPRRQQLEARVAVMTSIPPEPLELIQAQAQEITALDTEVKELRAEGLALRQEDRERAEAVSQLQKSLKEAQAACSVRRVLVVGGVAVAVGTAVVIVWRRH